MHIKNKKESIDIIGYFKKAINNQDIEQFNIYLKEYAPILKKEDTIHTLYGITMHLVKKIKNYKPYIDSIYQNGLSLDYKKTKQDCFSYDILTYLIGDKKKDIADYIINKHKYPKKFYGVKNYLAEQILYRKIKNVEQLLSEGFSSPEYKTAFDFINPQNFNQSIKQLLILQKYKKISSDNTEIFSNIFVNNTNSFTIENLKKLFNVLKPDLSSPVFTSATNNNVFFIKHLIEDQNKIDLLNHHGFSLINYLSNTTEKNLINLSEILIEYFGKLKEYNNNDIDSYLNKNNGYLLFSNLEYPEIVSSRISNLNYILRDKESSYINIPAILKLFNFDSAHHSEEEFHNFTSSKFSIIYNISCQMLEITENYKKEKIEYEKVNLNKILNQEEPYILKSNRNRL